MLALLSWEPRGGMANLSFTLSAHFVANISIYQNATRVFLLHSNLAKNLLYEIRWQRHCHFGTHITPFVHCSPLAFHIHEKFAPRYLTFFYIQRISCAVMASKASMRMSQRNGRGFAAICETFYKCSKANWACKLIVKLMRTDSCLNVGMNKKVCFTVAFASFKILSNQAKVRSRFVGPDLWGRS